MTLNKIVEQGYSHVSPSTPKDSVYANKDISILNKPPWISKHV